MFEQFATMKETMRARHQGHDAFDTVIRNLPELKSKLDDAKKFMGGLLDRGRRIPGAHESDNRSELILSLFQTRPGRFVFRLNDFAFPWCFDFLFCISSRCTGLSR